MQICWNDIWTLRKKSMLCLLFSGVFSVDHHVPTHFTGATHNVCARNEEMDRCTYKCHTYKCARNGWSLSHQIPENLDFVLQTPMVETSTLPYDPAIFYHFHGPNQISKSQNLSNLIPKIFTVSISPTASKFLKCFVKMFTNIEENMTKLISSWKNTPLLTTFSYLPK